MAQEHTNIWIERADFQRFHQSKLIHSKAIYIYLADKYWRSKTDRHILLSLRNNNSRHWLKYPSRSQKNARATSTYDPPHHMHLLKRTSLYEDCDTKIHNENIKSHVPILPSYRLHIWYQNNHYSQLGLAKLVSSQSHPLLVSTLTISNSLLGTWVLRT